MTNVRFYGIQGDPEDPFQNATLTLERPEDQGTFPVLLGEPVNAEDADTGPIIRGLL